MKVTDTLTPGLRTFERTTFARLSKFMTGATHLVQSEARKSLTRRYRGNPNTGGRATGHLSDSIYVETHEIPYTKIQGLIIVEAPYGVYVEFGPKDDSKLRHFVSVRSKGVIVNMGLYLWLMNHGYTIPTKKSGEQPDSWGLLVPSGLDKHFMEAGLLKSIPKIRENYIKTVQESFANPGAPA